MVKGKGKRKAPESKGRGRGRRQCTPSRPSPTSIADADEDEVIGQQKEVEEEAGSSGDSARDVSPASGHPKKKPKKITDLTDEEEEVMALWIRENECLYNKKLNAYKDTQKKNKLWDEQAKEMNKDMDMLQIWYRSLRTRYGRLLKKTSGDGAAEFTERDQWILAQFAFLRAHIYDVKKRTTVSVSTIK